MEAVKKILQNEYDEKLANSKNIYENQIRKVKEEKREYVELFEEIENERDCYDAEKVDFLSAMNLIFVDSNVKTLEDVANTVKELISKNDQEKTKLLQSVAKVEELELELAKSSETIETKENEVMEVKELHEVQKREIDGLSLELKKLKEDDHQIQTKNNELSMKISIYQKYKSNFLEQVSKVHGNPKVQDYPQVLNLLQTLQLDQQKHLKKIQSAEEQNRFLLGEYEVLAQNMKSLQNIEEDFEVAQRTNADLNNQILRLSEELKQSQKNKTVDLGDILK